MTILSAKYKQDEPILVEQQLAEMGITLPLHGQVVYDGTTMPVVDFNRLAGGALSPQFIDVSGDAVDWTKLTSAGATLFLHGRRVSLSGLVTAENIFGLTDDMSLHSLVSIGAVNLKSYTGELPSLRTVTGHLVLSHVGDHPKHVPRPIYPHRLDHLERVAGPLWLGHYAHELPALNKLCRSVDYGEYTHELAGVIRGGLDHRNFYVAGVHDGTQWRIRAGCRDFSITEARVHWGERGSGASQEIMDLIDKIEVEIARRATEGQSP